MNKYDKFNKFLKLFIIVLAAILIVATPVSIYFYSKEDKTSKNECIKKGDICTDEEIYNGVKVSYEVKSGTTKEFYVIANDKDQMTLLAAENISEDVDWHSEMVNVKGPLNATISLVNATKNWKSVPTINNYRHKDTGLETFKNTCSGEGENKSGYDCYANGVLCRGYNEIIIQEGLTIFNTNIVYQDPSIPIDNVYEISGTTRARMITIDELLALKKDNKYPSWLIENLKEDEGYWTLDSSTASKNNYNQGAYALANKAGSPSTESLFVQKETGDQFTIGIRPVIVVNK